jgi:secreted PhoX family phosphatase
MLAADVSSGEIRRFLTGPAGCEVTGITMVSNWPDQRPDGRPRSATVAIRREDGGPIGA